MTIKFMAKVGEMRWGTSIGRSLTIVIPREQREAEGIRLGDWVKIICKKENFEDLIKEVGEFHVKKKEDLKT